MDYCGAFKINNKCIDSANNKLQLANCSEGQVSQKFIYDSYTKTIRPLDGSADTCVGLKGGVFELQVFNNSSSQKFNYDSVNSRFNLESDTSNCINYSVDKFIASTCSTADSQKFTITKCTSSVDAVLEKILTSLKISKANASILSGINEADQTSSIIKLAGTDNMVYFAFYLSIDSTYSFKIESKTSKPAPYMRGVSLNTSPFMSNVSNDSYRLLKGIHIAIVWLERGYSGVAGVDYIIKIIDKRTNVEYNVDNLKLSSVGGIPMEEWLFSSILNTMKNYNNNSNMKTKYINYVSNPVSSYGNVSNLALQPVNNMLSNYSEYAGNCAPDAACGFNSKVKFKQIIPASYINASDEFTDDDIYYYEHCNKFCRDEAGVFSKWKEITKCPASKMPESTKEKNITSVDENGKEVVEESAIYIDNLRYHKDENLSKVFSLWSTPTYKQFSDECYGNILSDGNILRSGARIFSKDGISYLEYSETGRIALFSVDDTGAYTETASIRAANSSKPGSFFKLMDGKILIYKTVVNGETSTDSLIESLTITNTKVNLLITTFSILVLDTSGVFINRFGLVPSDLLLTEDITEYKFKSPSGSTAAYEIIRTDDTSLVITKTRLEFRVREKDNAGVVTETAPLTIPISSTEFICFNENGFYVSNGTLKTFESKATGVKLFGLYSGGIEMKNSEGWLIKNHGANLSTLNSLTTIRKPVIPDESGGIAIVSSSSKGKLVYQTDGNLVFYSDGKPLWNSNTQNGPSTHMMLDKSGEIVIMNDKTVVYRSNFSLKNSIFAILFVFDEWFFVCNKESAADNNLYISRLYPNAADLMSNNMTSLISAHITANYKKYPNIVIVDSTYSNTGNESGSVNTEYIDFTEFLRSYNFLQCQPTDFLCNLTKTTTVDPSNSKRKLYNVEIDTANAKWSHVKAKSLITGEFTNADTKKPELFKYGGRRLYGYTPLISSKYLGMNSSPLIKVKFANSSIDCILLIKKGLDDYDVQYDEALSYINSNVTSRAQLDMLDFQTSFQKNSNNVYELDPLKKAFTDRNGDFERVDDVKVDYCGTVKVSGKCLSSSADKVQITDCDNSNNQKYVFDFITQTLRPSLKPEMAFSSRSTTVDSDMGLMAYTRGANQKFIYDNDKSRLILVADKSLCVELSSTANGSGFNLKPCSTSTQQNIYMNSCMDADLKKILANSVKPPVVKYSITGFVSDLSKDRNYRDKVINDNRIISGSIIPLLGLEGVDIFKVHSSFSMKPDVASSFDNMSYSDNWYTILLFIFTLVVVVVVVIFLKKKVQKRDLTSAARKQQ